MRPSLSSSRRGVLAAALITVPACAPAPVVTPGPVQEPGSEYVVRSRQAFVAGIDSMVRTPEFRNAHWGILIVDPARGDTLYSHNAGKLFMPASNQKILTGAVSLARLGADYRYRTAFVATGPVENGVLQGDLMVMGSGDPTVSMSVHDDAMLPLLAIADSLATRGVRQIAGTVRSGRDAFPGDIYGFGWAYDDFDYAYSAPVDELMFNESFTRVTVRGTTPGQPPTVTIAPTPRGLAVQLEAVTVARDTAANARIQYFGAESPPGDSIRNMVRLVGTIQAGDSVRFNVAHRSPSGAYLDALTAALTSRGIAVGRQSLSDSAVYADTLFLQHSPPLREILPVFEKPSQNQIGEVLLRTLGLEETGSGTALAGRRVIEEQLVAWGADTAGFAVRDGSGLSRHNYVTPETVVRVLDAMRQHPDFRIFYDALPIAGVDGTIRSRMRGTPAEQNVHAKTGTIDKARALSGYVTTADGHLLLFSTIANNHSVPNRYVERVQDVIGAQLAASRLSDLRR
jgi:D-alanyl-D-alanine carboxypeptidase/D-alanyl-D-alanine-endopeptidase (penicillin-binding protein 4)